MQALQITLLRLLLPHDHEEECLMERADFEQQQAEEERYRHECEALDRCAKAGADIEDLKTLARGCGINIKHTVLGDEIRLKNERRAA